MSSIHDVKMPRGEVAWAGYYDKDERLRFIITSKETRDWYYLYAEKDGALVKLGKAKEPPELLEKYDVLAKIAGKCA